MTGLAPRAAGSHRSGGPNSASGLLSTLIPTLLVAFLLIGLFLFLRPRLQRLYIPRTYLGVLSPHEKTPRTHTSLLGWIPEFFRIDDVYVLNHHSLDAYFFLRFWKCLITATSIGWPLTWLVLMPVYATSHGGQQQFDKISFSNIDAAQDSNRLYAVAFVSWLVLGMIMYLIGRECLFCVKLQQAYLRLPGNASRISSRTVVFTDVPTNEVSSEEKLRQIFPNARMFWTTMDTKELDDLLEDRDKAVNQLEFAMVHMSKAATDRQRKLSESRDQESQESVVEYVYSKVYPTHRLRPLIGKKVETLPWGREQLQDLNSRIRALQESHVTGKGTFIPAVFVEFDTVEAAEAVFHHPSHGGWVRYRPRAIGSKPQEIIWNNLKMGKTQRTIRGLAVIAVLCAMTVFWGPITAFIGSLTNINYLTNMVPFLGFIQQIPSSVLGVVTSLLPVLLLTILMILVPVIMRVLFRLCGAVTTSEVELRTQTWYFIFQVIQVFLITTLSSGAAATATQIIEQPQSATNLLASNLPKASNFYISYFVLYGLVIATKSLFNIVAVLVYFVAGKFLDKTPRKIFNRYTTIAGLKWGSVFPKFTNLAVIAITYSCISPLVLAFATIGFVFLGYAFRYAVVYSVDVTNMDTRGRAYSKALQQLTTGVYLAELCLIGLMSIATNSSAAAVGPLVLMVIFLVITILYHILLNQAVAELRDDIADEFTSTYDRGSDEEHGVHEKVRNISRVTGKYSQRYSNAFVRTMHIPSLPTFDEYLKTPICVYTKEDERKAYMHPSIIRPTPLLWTVHDDAGIIDLERKAMSDVAEITDEGAWWDKKTGKLTTVWSLHEKQVDENVLQGAPLWERKVHY